MRITFYYLYDMIMSVQRLVLRHSIAFASTRIYVDVFAYSLGYLVLEKGGGVTINTDLPLGKNLLQDPSLRTGHGSRPQITVLPWSTEILRVYPNCSDPPCE